MPSSERHASSDRPIPIRVTPGRDPAPIARPPAPLADPIGREWELAAIRAHLADPGVRLLTLTGPGGGGKTTLALAAAREFAEVSSLGVRFVDLSPLTEARAVLPAIAHALNVRETGADSHLQDLACEIGERHLLLVLDNFEHVVDAAPAVAALVRACPRLKLLVTSRRLLNVSGERVLQIGPLALPGEDSVPDADELMNFAAVRLFVERAAFVDEQFRLTAVNAPDVLEICRQVDGLPLGIELAAARVPVLPPAELRARLDRRLSMLSGGPRDLPDRQRTMRGAIFWSYDLLMEDERALFRWLAPFAGGFTLNQADAISRAMAPAGAAAPPVIDRVGALLSHSLLARVRDHAQAGAELRFTLLQTIREFAQERLEMLVERDPVERAHAGIFLALAEDAESRLIGPDQPVWLDRLEIEHANLRTALSWAIRTGETEIGLRIAGALERFWDHRGYYGEGRRWLSALLERDGASPLVRAKALRAAGVLAIEQADFNQAAQFLTIALELARAGGDVYGTAQALNALGSVALWRGDDAGSEGFFIAALDLMRALEDDDGTAALLAQLGYVELNSGRIDSARARFVDALAFYERVGNGIGRVKMLTLLGWALLEQGDHQAAATILAEALHLNEAFGYHSYDAAGLEGMAAVATFRGTRDSVRAAHLFGASAAVRAAIGAPAWPGDAVRLARFVERARENLGDDAFDQARAAGQALSIEAARAEARQLVATNSLATSSKATLTARELDVLRLVKSGLTDREIAERCFISKRTVQNHVANAFAKLNVRTRGDAVDVAISRGMF